jgi:hypothetical protein
LRSIFFPSSTGIIAVAAWVGGVSAVFFFGLQKLNKLRVSEEDEDDGLDIATHGGFAYSNRPSEMEQQVGNSRVAPA